MTKVGDEGRAGGGWRGRLSRRRPVTKARSEGATDIALVVLKNACANRL